MTVEIDALSASDITIRLPPGWSMNCYDYAPSFRSCGTRAMPASSGWGDYYYASSYGNLYAQYGYDFTRFGQWHFGYDARYVHYDGHSTTVWQDNTYKSTPTLACYDDSPPYAGCRW